MKSIIYSSFILLFALSLNAQVGIGTSDPKAALDIESADNGLLIPRVALTSTTDATTIITATESELVYNTATIADVTPGFYYLIAAGGPWVRFGGATGWLTTGNPDIVDGTNFIGTITNIDVAFRRNDLASGRLSTSNTSFGVGSMINSNFNGWNTAFGVNALSTNSTGIRNVAIGHQALATNTTERFNIAIGYTALAVNNGERNVAIGDEALARISSGAAQDNVAIGFQAMDFGGGIANRNVAIGAGALRFTANNSSGNVGVGYNAGSGITNGGNNIVIGNNAQVPNATGSNQISIGNLIYGSLGNIGIGTNAPTALLSVNGTANKPGGSTWGVFSDRRSKENIETYTNGLNELMKINPVKFNYKKEFGWGTKTYIGLIAQDIQKVVPSMVTEKEVNGIKDFKEVDPNELTYILINSIKEQQAIIKKFKQDNDNLKLANLAILKRLEALEAGKVTEVAEATEVAEKK